MTIPDLAPPGPLDLSGVPLLGDIVAVWAHPDDETYIAGGLLATAAALGARVVCVTATDGDLGGPPDARADTAAVRVRELRAALAALGITEQVRLGAPDGECDVVDPAPLIATIGRVLRNVQPQTVVTFGSDGLTGHEDHRAVSRWTSAALRAHGGPSPRLLHAVVADDDVRRFGDLQARYDVYAPGLPTGYRDEELAVRLDLSGGLLARKRRALAAHRSQTEALAAAVGEDRYLDWVATECFVDASPMDGWARRLEAVKS